MAIAALGLGTTSTRRRSTFVPLGRHARRPASQTAVIAAAIVAASASTALVALMLI